MDVLIIVLIGIVAFMYASVGHGGASGYLALMAIFSIDPELMRSSALVLNIFVSGIAFYQYYRSGFFKWKIFMPFAIGSVPMAYIGGSLTLDPFLYKKILGACLIFAILKILGLLGKESGEIRKLNFPAGILIGAFLGLISGIIGIGGGIILSPVILLFKWADMKTTAAVSALFIFVNSTGGLAGLHFSGNFNPVPNLYIWIIVALAGGLAGGYLGSSKVSNNGLRKVLGTVLILASIKLLFL